MKKLTHEQLQVLADRRYGRRVLPFCAVLDDIRSAENVGSMFRTADAVGLEKLWLCGITCTPPNPLLRKTALDAEDHVAWEYREHLLPAILDLKNRGYQIVLLEQTDVSVPVQEFVPRGPMCLVVGNEVEGVNDEVLSLADAAVEIEMSGVKNSLNAAVAFGIAAYGLKERMF